MNPGIFRQNLNANNAKGFSKKKLRIKARIYLSWYMYQRKLYPSLGILREKEMKNWGLQGGKSQIWESL